MKPILKLALIAAVAPLLMAAIWMDRQPGYRPNQPPLLAPPADSVPVSGREVITQRSEPANPVAASTASLARGKALFEINCAMCHGITSAERGAVGKTLNPPPPGLDHEQLQALNDAFIYKAITLGFGRMPAFRERIDPLERWDLVNFLRTRNP